MIFRMIFRVIFRVIFKVIFQGDFLGRKKRPYPEIAHAVRNGGEWICAKVEGFEISQHFDIFGNLRNVIPR